MKVFCSHYALNVTHNMTLNVALNVTLKVSLNVTLRPTLSELWSWQPTVTIGKCDTQYDLMWLTM